jgi:endoglucanase
MMGRRMHNAFRVSAFSVVVALLTASSVSLAQGYLHASGIYIVDGNNNQIQLRGMGLGGWLVPEGYMLQTSSFANSPTEIRSAIENLVGSSNADKLDGLYRSTFVQRKDIDSLARWGFNSVRLPMHFNLLSPSPGEYLEPGFAIIDSLLDWCTADQLYLILDLHCAPGGQNSINISDYQGFPSLWESPDFQTWTAEIWKTIAARYSTHPWIGGYDLLNETAWSFSGGNAPLRNLLVRITDSIRTVDRNHMIFAEGNWYATDFSNLTPSWDANMAWSFHKYWNTNEYSSFQSFLTLRANTNTPLWMGESGENSNQWFSDAIFLLEAYHIGWSWWTHKKIESISCPLSVTKTSDYDQLLKYWSGQGSQPTVTQAMNALTAQIQLFDAGLCTRHPDFLHALLVMPHSSSRTPWTANTIPGVLYPVNYDLGRQGSSYSDVDYQNTGGSGGPAYNSGWTYRNDGVDIETCTDSLSNGYDIGWTNTGEYVAFTVNVQAAGTYSLTARVASGSSGGRFSLSADDADLTSAISVPGTGGWQKWTNVTAGPFSLSAGAHDLKVNFLSSNVNMNRLEFTLLATGVATEQSTPDRFALLQNYPNPFNPSTTLGYTVGVVGLPAGQAGGRWPVASSHVRLAVYDMLGREVAVLVDEKKAPGNYEVQFDASGLASGIYVYRLTANDFVQCKEMVVVR